MLFHRHIFKKSIFTVRKKNCLSILIQQVIAAIAILYQYIGVSALAGLFVLLLTVPLNSYLAARQQTLQVMNLELKDSRLRLTNEALAGVKVSTASSWHHANIRLHIFPQTGHYTLEQAQLII